MSSIPNKVSSINNNENYSSDFKVKNIIRIIVNDHFFACNNLLKFSLQLVINLYNNLNKCSTLCVFIFFHS